MMIDYDETRFPRYPVPADDSFEEMPNHWFVFDRQERTLALLRCVEGHGCFMIGQVSFTLVEFPVVSELFANAPWHSPAERLYAAFQFGSVTEKRVEQSRDYLLKAAKEGVYDLELRPLRNVLSRVRLKLSQLEIAPVSIIGTGYMLRRITPITATLYGRKRAHEDE